MIRKALAVLATAALAAVATGCAEFDHVELTQSATRTVDLDVSVCAGDSDACSPMSGGWTVQLGFAASLPDGVTAPATITTTGAQTLTLSEQPADTASLDAATPAGAGRHWVAYRSGSFVPTGTDTGAASIPLTIPQSLTGTLEVTTKVAIFYSSPGPSCAGTFASCVTDTASTSVDLAPELGIAVTAPADGATYTAGSTVKAAYSCTGAAAGKCAGPVADGAAIDTATPGTKTFTVDAEDPFGATGHKTVTFTVVAAKAVEQPKADAPKVEPAVIRTAPPAVVTIPAGFAQNAPANVAATVDPKVARGQFTVSVANTNPFWVAVRVAARGKGRTLAWTTVRVAPKSTADATLALTAAGRRLLRQGALPVVTTLKVRDAARTLRRVTGTAVTLAG